VEPGDVEDCAMGDLPRWLRGLEQTGAMLCDAKTAANRALPKGPRIFVFPILFDAVRDDLAQFSDTSQFL
jgi:hypothetical protein